MLAKPFEDVQLTDIEQLVFNRVAEGRDLEFKRELPGENDKGRKEFLADVTSFANAQGGDLIYGIAEANDDGIAGALLGIDVAEPEKQLRALDDRIRDGVEPRIPGVRLKWIALADGKYLLHARIPASVIAPHRVIVAGGAKFWSRKSNGKYEMDTQELRDAFSASDALPARLRTLHEEAVEAERRELIPRGLVEDPKALVSVIPMQFFRVHRDLDFTRENALMPVTPEGRVDFTYMMEGVLLSSLGGSISNWGSYALTHFRGRIDVAWSMGLVRNEGRRDEQRFIPYQRFKDGLMDAALSSIGRLRQNGIEGPWVVLTSVLGIRHHTLVVDNDHYSQPAWRDRAVLQEVVLAQDHTPSPKDLAPVLKSFRLLFGMPPLKDPEAYL
ncbi:helix-turn-helix domain-containing protein [Vitreimonas flagellata]|uniref:AlbA family DNA-binding domain-containing protein n=1 Tax=Vitreimonas flagellata TaxID=2560861 RepID=UPI0010751ACC|nr:ATP-binding protein [Vitreimonas flagellata]